MTFRLLESIRPQLEAGIGLVAGGGEFYAERWQGALGGVREGVIRADLFADPGALAMDARAIASATRMPFAAMPIPSALGLADRHYRDRAEADAAVRDVFGVLMRAMRDAGVAGHVLIAASPPEDEIEDLASPFTFILCRDPTAETLDALLDHQRAFALPGNRVGELAAIIDQTGRRPVYLLDPDEGEIGAALGVLDPEYVRVGGLCPGDCDDYWRRLAPL